MTRARSWPRRGPCSHRRSPRTVMALPTAPSHRTVARPAGRRARRLPHPRHAAHLHRWPFGPAADVHSSGYRRRLPALPDRLGPAGTRRCSTLLAPFAVLWGRHLIGHAPSAGSVPPTTCRHDRSAPNSGPTRAPAVLPSRARTGHGDKTGTYRFHALCRNAPRG
jgi:hypothetical protein